MKYTASERTAPVISFVTAKAHMHLDDDDEKEFVEGLIEDSTCYAEMELQSTIGTRTVTATFYPCETIRLPAGPVRTITSVTDANDVAITYRQEGYGTQDYIIPTSSVTYPVIVTYTAGMDLPGQVRRLILEDVHDRWANPDGNADGKRSDRIARTFQHMRRQSPIQ